MTNPRSLSGNILANYVSVTYIMLIGIFMVPLYLKYMGAEAYGLVAFFALLQAFFNLLDIGLTPTMARETARFRGGATDALSYRRLASALQTAFLVVAFVVGSALFASSGFIASDWLKVQALPLNEVRFAVRMMGLGAALRWMAGLSRGIISGSERLVWLSSYNIIIATLRFAGVIPVLIFVGTTPSVFFTYQLFVAMVEFAGLATKAYKLLPNLTAGQHLGWSLAPIKPVLKFSLTIAFTSVVGLLATQSDKVVLSKTLSLREFGYFSLAVLVAGTVNTIGEAISQALTPRLVTQLSAGDERGFLLLYRRATQWVCVVVAPVSITLAVFAEPLLLAWTGSAEIAHKAAPMLLLYSIGNGVHAIAAFQYYLQFAKGNLRLHLIGSLIFAVVLIPLTVLAATKYGGVGAGYVWAGQSLFFMVFWTWLVQRRFVPGLYWHWLARDVLPVWLWVVAVAIVVNWIGFDMEKDRWVLAANIMGVGAGFLLVASLASSDIRNTCFKFYCALRF